MSVRRDLTEAEEVMRDLLFQELETLISKRTISDYNRIAGRLSEALTSAGYTIERAERVKELESKLKVAEARIAQVGSGCITGEGSFEETAPLSTMTISRSNIIKSCRKYFGSPPQRIMKFMADNADWDAVRDHEDAVKPPLSITPPNGGE
jgi:hypothetical protein